MNLGRSFDSKYNRPKYSPIIPKKTKLIPASNNEKYIETFTLDKISLRIDALKSLLQTKINKDVPEKEVQINPNHKANLNGFIE